MPELKDLIERLEKAEGPSEELGVRVLSALLSKQPIVTVEQSMINGAWCAYYEGYDGKPRLWERPSPFREMGNVTASLDAVVALVERVRPGWGFYLRRDTDGCGAGLVPAGLSHVTLAHCKGATPAIALCLALLKSLEQQP
jgi:hypothetical protein